MTPEQQKALALAAARRRRALAQPEQVSTEQEGASGYFGNLLRNIPSSGKNYIEDIMAAITSPVESAKAVGNVALGAAEKLVPGEQGAEPYADAAWQAITNRYGSWGKFKQTLERDPVGTLADISGVVSAGGAVASKIPGLAKTGGAVARAGVALDPVNMAGNTVKAAASKLIPKGTAAALYESAAKWRPSIPKRVRERLTETALREQIMPTTRGAHKAQGLIESLNAQVDDLIDIATSNQATVPVDVLKKNIAAVKQELGGLKANAPNDLRVVDDLVKQWDDYTQSLGVTDVTPADLQRFKKDIYKRINWDMEQGQANYAANETRKSMASAARDEIEQIVPEVSDLNRREGSLIELRPEVERAANRIENRDIFGLSPTLNTGIGASLGGGPGAVMGAVAGAATMPQMKARTALYIDALKRRGALGQFTDNSMLAYLLRQGALQGGRAGQLEPAD